MDSKKRIRRSRKAEKRAAESLTGGRKTIASGRFAHDKGDGISPLCLIEHKQRQSQFYVSEKVWMKHKKDADNRGGIIPVFCIELLSTGDEVAVLTANDFEELGGDVGNPLYRAADTIRVDQALARDVYFEGGIAIMAYGKAFVVVSWNDFSDLHNQAMEDK